MWLLLALLSALCLGFYDVSKKLALQHHRVIDVLTLSILISSAILAVPLVLSRLWPDMLVDTAFYVPGVDLRTHGFILLKSALVLVSWLCTYAAVKHLPLSVVSPMQATRPMWTLAGALLLFGETLNGWQWAGIGSALGSIFLFSFFERKEAVRANREGQGIYYVLLVGAILTGAASGLYDKYMMRRFDHNAVQVYYTLYQALFMLVIWAVEKHRQPAKSRRVRFSTGSWQTLWPIPMISIMLVLSDYVYLLALSDPASLIAVVSTIRRGGTIIPFLYGILVLKEKDPWKKVLCLLGIAAGLAFLAFGS